MKNLDRKEERVQLLYALISGILLGVSFPPIPLFFLSFIAFVPFLKALEQRVEFTSIFRLFYTFGLVFNLITLYWVGSWTPEADPFLKISGILLIFFNPLFVIIPSTLFYFSRKVLSKNSAYLLLPFFWITYEYFMTLTQLRFPWLSLGNGVTYFNLFIQLADIVGVYGLSLLILFSNITLFFVYQEFNESGKLNKLKIAVFISLLLVPMLYGFFRISTLESSSRKIKAAIIQPDFNPWNKWDAGNLNTQLETYLELSRAAVKSGAELIAWPETALPVYIASGGYPLQMKKISSFVKKTGVPILTGMPDAFFYKENPPIDAKKTASGNYYTSYNSILYFSALTDTLQRYQKILLVPFGEKVPYVEYLPFLGELFKWEVGISSWNSGENINLFVDTINGNEIKIGGIICIESIYPDFTTQFVRKGAEILAVVTNDSWYGYSSGPFQHKEIAKLRSIENRRWIIRSSNGGISGFISPKGNIYEETELFTKDKRVFEIEKRNDISFYTKYPFIIPYLALTISFLQVLYFIFISIRLKHYESN